jgi:hypothetical protein
MTDQYETVPEYFRPCIEDIKDQIPTSWEYYGSHNDACPSWQARGLQIFMDHPDPAMREDEDWFRFCVHQIDGNVRLIETDSFDDLIKFVNEY